MDAKTVVLQNEACMAAFHTTGGALVDFRLQPAGVNPLNFWWEEKGSVSFRGHFLCLGRWGDPSLEEARRGHVKHGDFNRLQWNVTARNTGAFFTAHSALEGLHIDRDVVLDTSAAIMLVKESVQNTNSVGRLYNMVQHPTLAHPFLDANTVVDCNATLGFDYAFSPDNESIFGNWPEVRTYDGGKINLLNPDRAYSSVFSFIVNPSDEWAWVTAYAPTQQTVLGYVWKRTDYPWINHWLHFEKGLLQYRGLEFGTTGVHKPVKEIWDKDLPQLLGEKTCCFLDTGETQHRAYMTFLLPVHEGFEGVQQVRLEGGAVVITEKESNERTTIFHHLNTAHAFQQ